MNVKKRLQHLCLAGVLWLWAGASLAQTVKTYPTHWFTGMKWNQVQLLLHAPNLGQGKPTASISYPGVNMRRVQTTESPNYLLLDVAIAPSAKAGTISIRISRQGQPAVNVPFELKPRRSGMGRSYANGVNSTDLVYLIMPDRFANGNPANDRIPGYRDTICDRRNPSAHHGGDLLGVQQKLPYLKDLGATAIWLCPIVENDMPWKEEPAGAISGYHGYWITNHYEIDKRYGSAADYKNMINAAHQQGIKVIQDAVYNHVGDEHFLFRDKPFAAMFNSWPSYTGSNHREETLLSGYGAAADKKQMLEGWFTPHLPDVNLRHPVMANFLIQNAIWCTEEFGIDGWRVDTYKYCDEQFMNNVNTALLKEFPTLSIFGEAWANTVAGSAYFVKNNMKLPFQHNLPGTTDFPMQSAMLTAINQGFGWTEGVNKLMMTLAQDVLYQNPLLNCIFLDNHDVDRYVTMIGGDMKKYKMGMALLMTLRGIPQLYFGAEVFLANDNVQGDGKKRNDFPGGFAGDGANKFEAAGRSPQENEAFNYVRALANFRKQSKALALGSTTTYLPQDGVFVYLRKSGTETVMVVVNQQMESRSIQSSRFAGDTKGFTSGKEVTSDVTVTLGDSWTIPGQTVWVLSLK